MGGGGSCLMHPTPGGARGQAVSAIAVPGVRGAGTGADFTPPGRPILQPSDGHGAQRVLRRGGEELSPPLSWSSWAKKETSKRQDHFFLNHTRDL